VAWEKVVCWGTKAAISLKRVKIEEKLLLRAYRKSPMHFRFFGSPPYFYFRFRLYSHRDGLFCLIFARTTQQSVLDGTNGLSSFKTYAYCQIVHCADIFAIAQLSCIFSNNFNKYWSVTTSINIFAIQHIIWRTPCFKLLFYYIYQIIE